MVLPLNLADTDTAAVGIHQGCALQSFHYAAAELKQLLFTQGILNVEGEASVSSGIKTARRSAEGG